MLCESLILSQKAENHSAKLLKGRIPYGGKDRKAELPEGGMNRKAGNTRRQKAQKAEHRKAEKIGRRNQPQSLKYTPYL